MRTTQRIAAALAAVLMISTSADAALISRAGGQAYYDTVLDITWLANANLADTNDFGVIGIVPDGRMTWAKAGEWIAAMNTANYLGVNTWRLPTVSPVDGSSFDYTIQYDGSSDRGYNIGASGSTYPGSTGSEMAHLFYSTLGNTGYYDTSGSPTGCSGSSPYCMTNTGPFSNLQHFTPNLYWSGTTYAPDSSSAWVFDPYFGSQGPVSKGPYGYYAWAVSPGDNAAVPVPGAVWLFGSAVAVMGALRRRVLNRTAA